MLREITKYIPIDRKRKNSNYSRRRKCIGRVKILINLCKNNVKSDSIYSNIDTLEIYKSIGKTVNSLTIDQSW